MNIWLYVFILSLFLSCLPKKAQQNQSFRSFNRSGLSPVSMKICLSSGGTWDGSKCSIPVIDEEAKTPEECQVSGGIWDGINHLCNMSVVMGAVIEGVETEEECNTKDGIWQVNTCYIKESDLGSYNYEAYVLNKEDCLGQGGIWANDYCTLPTDESFEMMAKENNPCDKESSSYNEYVCQNSSQGGCESSSGTWDVSTLTCICEHPLTWSETYLSCGYYSKVPINYNDEVLLQIYNGAGGNFFSIYVLEVNNAWAAYKSWSLRNDVYNSLVAGGATGASSVVVSSTDVTLVSPDTSTTTTEDSIDSTTSYGLVSSEEGGESSDVEKRKCYMRFKIKNASSPSDTGPILNGDEVTLEVAGLCEDEDHCDVYYNRETSVSIAAAVGIGLGIGLASVGVIAATIATGGALVGAVAGAGAATAAAAGTVGAVGVVAASSGATAAGAGAAAAATMAAAGASTAAAATAAATTAAGVAGATAGTAAASVAAAGTAAASAAGAGAVSAAAMGAGAAGLSTAAAGAGAALTTGKLVAAGVAGAAVGVGTGIAAAQVDWGHVLAHDEYIESDLNLEWSKFTGSDVFKIKIEGEQEGLTIGGDPNAYSLSFHLTTVNTEHEDRHDFYLRSDEEVVLAEKTHSSEQADDIAGELSGDQESSGASYLRVQFCTDLCKEIEKNMECWDD